MSNTILRLRCEAPSQPLHEVCEFLIAQLIQSAEPVARRETDFSDGSAAELIFEKFFFRNGSYASLTIFLTERAGAQEAQVVGFGGGAGIFNISLWANSDLAEAAASALESVGFVQEESN